MTFFSAEHTFIICCGNKCSFIDYKIKVSSLGIFSLRVSVSVFVCLYRAIIRPLWTMVNHSSGLILYHTRTFFRLMILFFLHSFFLLWAVERRVYRFTFISFHWFEKRASKRSKQNSLAARAHRMLCLRSLFLIHPFNRDVLRSCLRLSVCLCVSVHDVLGLQPLPTAVSKQ